MKTLDELTETEETRRGKLAADVLKLKPDREHLRINGETGYKTKWGTKTDLGLFRMIKRLVLDGADN